MQTISIKDFANLAETANWNVDETFRDVHWEKVPKRTVMGDDDWICQDATHVFGVAKKIISYKGIEVIYTEEYNYIKHVVDSYSSGTEGQEKVWDIKGVRVVDENGEQMSAEEVTKYLPGYFSEIDYTVNEYYDPEYLDYDHVDEGKEFVFERDYQPHLCFTGELIASSKTSGDPLSLNYKGKRGRWKELELYKTKADRFVCRTIYRTIWLGGEDCALVKVCDTFAEVKEFFGDDDLAKEIYESACI